MRYSHIVNSLYTDALIEHVVGGELSTDVSVTVTGLRLRSEHSIHR